MDALTTFLARWQSFLIENGPDFGAALWVTIRISLVAIVCGLALGFAAELGRRICPWLRKPVACYVEFFRGTPLLIQLYLLQHPPRHRRDTCGWRSMFDNLAAQHPDTVKILILALMAAGSGIHRLERRRLTGAKGDRIIHERRVCPGCRPIDG